METLLHQMSPEELQTIIQLAIAESLQKVPQAKNTQPNTIQEAGIFCRCAESTIRQAVRRGKVKFHRKSGRLYFFESDLIDWIKSK